MYRSIQRKSPASGVNRSRLSGKNQFPEGMAAFWTLDNTTGGYVDLIAGLTLTPVDVAPGVAAGISGNAAEFSGTGVLQVVDTPAVRADSAFTVEVWLRASDTSAGMLVAKDIAGNREYYLYKNSPTSIEFGVLNSLGVLSSAQANNLTLTGVWVHAIGTFDGTTTRIYINGVLQATAPFTGTRAAEGAPYQIGGRAFVGSNLRFNGRIDEAAHYRGVALTPNQVIERYNIHAAVPLSFFPDGMVARWTLDNLTTGLIDIFAGRVLTTGGPGVSSAAGVINNGVLKSTFDAFLTGAGFLFSQSFAAGIWERYVGPDYIFTQWPTSGSANLNWYLDSYGGLGRVRFFVQDGTSTRVITGTSDGIVGGWRYIVGVYDHTKPFASRLRLYVNGVLEATGFCEDAVITGPSPLWTTRRGEGGTSAVPTMVDEIEIFDFGNNPDPGASLWLSRFNSGLGRRP